GSGKSVHAEALEKKLNENGIPCTRIWARWISTISFPFRGLIYVLTGYRRKDYHKSRILRSYFAYLTIFDFLYLYMTKIKYQLLMGKIVICDRYVYDLIADLSHLGLDNERAVKTLLKVIPEPDIIFWLDLPEDIALSRKDDTYDKIPKLRSDNAIEYLKEQRKKYSDIANKMNIKPIYTTNEFDEVQDKIFEEVFYTYIKR
ncbi:MAG: hypothetical protein SVO01_01735, partial [Thermotogota bacterium]|nr:hypothetical protein [Thermotogota bacterium]